MSFSPGQRVRCVKPEGWRDGDGAPRPGPAPGECVTIAAVTHAVRDPGVFLDLREFGAQGAYPGEHFRALGD